VDDGGGGGVNAGHDEIGGWVLGRFDDAGDLAVRVGVTDAVSACVLPGDFREEEAASARSSRWRRTTSSRVTWKMLSPSISMNSCSAVSPAPPYFPVLPEFPVFVLALEHVDGVKGLLILVPINQDAIVTDAELVPRVILQPVEKVPGEIENIVQFLDGSLCVLTFEFV
jgi:hypothetical protein